MKKVFSRKNKLKKEEDFNIFTQFDSFLINKKNKLRLKKKKSIYLPMNYESMYERDKKNDKKDKIIKGLSKRQLKLMKSYSIVGESHAKKRNYETGINHLFNLRAMFKKINEIKYKNPKKILFFEKKKKIVRKKKNIVDKITENDIIENQKKILKSMIPKNFDDSFSSFDFSIIEKLSSKKEGKNKKKIINEKEDKSIIFNRVKKIFKDKYKKEDKKKEVNNKKFERRKKIKETKAKKKKIKKWIIIKKRKF